jgi:hypothetical protein
MLLKELIEKLDSYPRSNKVKIGFENPHSYRGYYEELAFSPVEDTTVGAMLDAARSALGNTYEGYKGGEFIMDGSTTCYLAYYSEIGEEIGPTLLGYMLGDYQI